MAGPIRHYDVDTLLKRAAQAAADADAATLENVRQRTERSERMRAEEFARVRAALKPAR